MIIIICNKFEKKDIVDLFLKYQVRCNSVQSNFFRRVSSLTELNYILIDKCFNSRYNSDILLINPTYDANKYYNPKNSRKGNRSGIIVHNALELEKELKKSK